MKFCFFGNVSGALKGQTVGGGELQISLVARALALQGHEVIIIDPFASEAFVTIEGVKLIPIPNWNKGPRGIRLFVYRIPALWKLLVAQNADYYYVRMRSYLHLIPFYASRIKGAKFVLAIAHDLDVLGFNLKFRHEYKAKFNLFNFFAVDLPNDVAFSFLLKHADYVVLQHPGQQFTSGSIKPKIVVFQNLIDTSKISMAKKPPNGYYVHVGSLTILKGAENLDFLIRDLDKNIQILIIGQPSDNKSRIIIERLKLLKNITIKGRLPHEETIGLIANARALITTSNFEGFPNVFLESWAAGVPVISLKVNPGNVFERFKVGVFCNGDLDRMRSCMESGETDYFDPNQLRSYVEQFHSLKDGGMRFLKALEIGADSILIIPLCMYGYLFMESMKQLLP